MREIRFRAFSKKFKEYISIGFSVLGETTAFNLVELWYIENKGIKEGLLDLVLNDVIIEQLTGVKDKNGVDIYEGDICNSSYFKKAEVVFWQNSWHFKVDNFYHHSFNTAIHSFEIIGDIKENPELL